MQKIPVAFSPCPNDTFLFHAWVSGRVAKQFPIQPVLADIQHLNEWALQDKYPLIKISISCLGHVLEHYHLLPVGCALGHGVGPKLIAKKNLKLDQLAHCTVALPGKNTTAALLYDLLLPSSAKKIFTSYEQIAPMIARGEVDAGVIIHETRFTYQNLGLKEVVDLGELWTERYHSPLPLGGIAARRDLSQDTLQGMIQALRESLLCAWMDPQGASKYVLELSQEKDPKVVGQHISTYVTQETFQLSNEGISSIDTMLKLSREQNLIPPCNQPWMAR